MAGIGVVLTTAQKGIRQGASLLKRRLLVDVEVDVRDESYQWFLYWMTTHQRRQLAPSSINDAPTLNGGFMQTLMRRMTPGMHHLSIATEKIRHPNGAVQTQFALIPGPGRHLLRYQNAFILVDRFRETKSTNLQTGKPWETVTLTTLYSQRQVFEDLFKEAHQLAQQSTEGKTIVYTSRSTSWNEFGEPRRKRPLDSVILDDGIKERIVDDVKEFLQSGKWYYDRGIPYRRGYLLYGRPGSGKSSFVQALAGRLDYNIAILNLSERGLTDDRLNYLLSIIPRRTLVLLEDADAAFQRRTQTDADGYSGANVTFSGLLNAIDGVASAEERVLFLTTNHVERLDPALIRPGRIDMAVHIGDVTRSQAGNLWERFYGQIDLQGTGKERFLIQLDLLGCFDPEHSDRPGAGMRASLSPAALQGLFLYNKDDLENAIKMVPNLLSSAIDADGGRGSRTDPLHTAYSSSSSSSH